MAQHFGTTRRASIYPPEQTSVGSPTRLATMGAACGAVAGLTPPMQTEAPQARGHGVRRGNDQRTANKGVCQVMSACNQAAVADFKHFSTLRPHLALAGWILTRTHADDGPVTVYVARWGMVRELRDITAVQAYAEGVGAPHG